MVGSSPASSVDGRSTSGSCPGHAFDAPRPPNASWRAPALNGATQRGWSSPEQCRSQALAAAVARARGKARRGALLEAEMGANDAVEHGEDDGQEGDHACVAGARLQGSRLRGASALMAKGARG